MLTRRQGLVAVSNLLFSKSANAALYLTFGSPVLLPVCRQYTVPDSRQTDTTNNSLNARMTCVAAGQILGLSLGFPGFGINNPEAPIPTGFTATCAVEYPAGIFTAITVGGNRALTITPGETVTYFDFLKLNIPAGATFWIKTWATWNPGNFWLGYCVASIITTDWTSLGTNLSDNTLTATIFSTTMPISGFGPIVFGWLRDGGKRLGIVGDSISWGFGDEPNTADNARFIERAMLDKIPTVQLSRGSNTFLNYLAQNTGQRLILDGNVNSLIVCLGNTEIRQDGATAAQCEAWLQQAIAPYLAEGVRVWAFTLGPITNSTDGWATIGNQTVASATNDTQRQLYNDWLRANGTAIGLAGVIDEAAATQAPGNSSLWNADGSPGTGATGFCTVVGGAVSACNRATYVNGNVSGGSLYPLSASGLTCTVRGYPGETGTLPTITATANGVGVVTSFQVGSAGSALLNPPMVAVNGAWTADGIHPNARGCNEIIFATGLGPTLLL